MRSVFALIVGLLTALSAGSASAQAGGGAGGLRIVLMGLVQKWTGERESEWRTHFQRTCPSGQCTKAVICAQ